jgi:hypothetical protein
MFPVNSNLQLNAAHFADDLVLLSSTVDDLQLVTSKCNTQISAERTKVMDFGKNKPISGKIMY